MNLINFHPQENIVLSGRHISKVVPAVLRSWRKCFTTLLESEGNLAQPCSTLPFEPEKKTLCLTLWFELDGRTCRKSARTFGRGEDYFIACVAGDIWGRAK